MRDAPLNLYWMLGSLEHAAHLYDTMYCNRGAGGSGLRFFPYPRIVSFVVPPDVQLFFRVIVTKYAMQMIWTQKRLDGR